MNALAITTIKKTDPLTILQRISEKDQITAQDNGNHYGNVIWLSRPINISGEADFARLYENTSGLIFGLLLRLLSDSQKAEEMMDSIYSEFRRETERFDAERKKPFIWLIGIAYRQGIEHLPLDRQFEVLKTVDGKTFLTV
jgi:hypothetical protein